MEALNLNWMEALAGGIRVNIQVTLIYPVYAVNNEHGLFPMMSPRDLPFMEHNIDIPMLPDFPHPFQVPQSYHPFIVCLRWKNFHSSAG